MLNCEVSFMETYNGALATLIIGILGLLLFNHFKKKEVGISITSAKYSGLLKSLAILCLKTNDLNDANALEVYTYGTTAGTKNLVETEESRELKLNFKLVYWIGGARFIRWHDKYLQSGKGAEINAHSIKELRIVLKQELGLTSWWVNIVYYLSRNLYK